MYDYKKIEELKPDDVLILNALQPLAERAKEIAKIINQTYLFRAHQTEIVVWKDEHNRELYTHDGVWQARYLHQKYDLKCTPEEIFEYMKAQYLVENGFVSEYNSKEGEMARIYRYFNGFVNKTEEIYKARRK